MGALYSHPKNPDIVRAALSAWLSIPDPDLDSFVRVIEGYMKFSSGHTDLMRLIAITAVGEACTGLDIDSFQEGFLIKLFRLLRLGLIDDDEDVRDAAAMAFTACFSYEKSSTSVPAALADLYLRAMKSLSPFGFKQLILNLSAPEWPIGEECEVLFVKEPENLFVNVEWEHRLIKNTL